MRTLLRILDYVRSLEMPDAFCSARYVYYDGWDEGTVEYKEILPFE